MPNVIACCKWVVDEADVQVADDRSVDYSRTNMKISDYDRNAIQVAVETAQELGGKAIGLSYGDDKLRKSYKKMLSCGLDELVCINDTEANKADSARTATVLASAVASQDNIALVVCADGSSDQFARQTAPRVAAWLKWPVVTSVSAIEVNGGVLKAARHTENGLEHVEVRFPVVVAVLPEAAEVPIPSLRQIMQASKRPVTEITIDAFASATSSQSSITAEEGYVSNRKNVMFDASDDSGVADFITALRREGVL